MLEVAEGWPGRSLRDEKGRKRAWLVAGEDGPNLLLADEKGRLIWSAP